jgi:hypothetical protein
MASLNALRYRAIERSPVKAPAFNVTLGTVGVLSLGTVLVVWREGFEYLFFGQEGVSPAVRASVLIATIAAIVVVVSVDMLARAIAVRGEVQHVVAMPRGWTASVVKDGAVEAGYLVAAVRAGDNGSEVLLVRDGEAPTWHSRAALVAPNSS